MSGGFPDDFKEQVRAQTDLVSLVAESVALSPRGGGREHVGLCPFHDDHNPSLNVNPERQTYRCWVCDEGGDCFSWVMRIDNVEFREALELLAERANLPVPRRRGRRDEDRRSGLYEIVAWAEEQFHRCLLESPEAERGRRYLVDQRRLDESTLRQFRIGFHPPGWRWLQDRARGHFTPEELRRVGLAKEMTGRPGLRDEFIDRVLFPIHDIRGRPVAFGGRILPDHDYPDAPKYLNSPESPLFAKSQMLYGLDVARDAIRKSGEAVVVEGYTDCVAVHRHGVGQVVGTLGTALTDQHVLALKRIASKVVLVYDGDQAGRMAAERSLPRFLAQDVDLRVLTLPDGLDPDEFLERHGAERFSELTSAAPEAWDYKFELLVERHGDGSSMSRQQLLDDMLALIAMAPRLVGTSREALLLGRLSQRLGIPEKRVWAELSARRQDQSPANRPNRRVDQGDASSTSEDVVESELLEIVFARPSTLERIRQRVDPADFSDPQLRLVWEVCTELGDGDNKLLFERLSSRIEDPVLKQLVVRIDERSRDKQIERRLDESTFDLVETTIDRLLWRKERKTHETVRGEWAARPAAGEGFDDEARRRLEQETEYHKKRLARKLIR